MKKYYFTIVTILFLAIGITSCTNEETKTQNQVAARPTVPVQNGEVQIGTQIRMTKNLNVSRYRNGDPIPQVTIPAQWQNLTTGASCYIHNIPANGAIYGKLYNGYAANDPRGLAPEGYHIPTRAEWAVLVNFLGGENVAGGKMKATTQWYSDLATNSSGFTALPAGCIALGGVYDYGFVFSSSISTYFWSSTQVGNPSYSICMLQYNFDYAKLVNGSPDFGFSVRCIKD